MFFLCVSTPPASASTIRARCDTWCFLCQKPAHNCICRTTTSPPTPLGSPLGSTTLSRPRLGTLCDGCGRAWHNCECDHNRNGAALTPPPTSNFFAATCCMRCHQPVNLCTCASIHDEVELLDYKKDWLPWCLVGSIAGEDKSIDKWYVTVKKDQPKDVEGMFHRVDDALMLRHGVWVAKNRVRKFHR